MAASSLSGHLITYSYPRESRKKHSIFVCSFSEDGDLLSQWRGYCGNGYGYSVGFRFETLQNALSTTKFHFYKCVYDAIQQDKLISDLLSDFDSKVDRFIIEKKHLTSNEIWELTGNELVLRLALMAPLLKNPAFSEEKEWRILSLRCRV